MKLFGISDSNIAKKRKEMEEQKKVRQRKVLKEQSKLKSVKEVVSAFEQFTEQEKETAKSLGWFNPSVTTEYRAGVMFQVARLHNNKRIMSRFVPKSIIKGSLSEPKRNIAPYVRLFYNSLALDKNCKDMSDVDIVNSDPIITDEDLSEQSYEVFVQGAGLNDDPGDNACEAESSE